MEKSKFKVEGKYLGQCKRIWNSEVKLGSFNTNQVDAGLAAQVLAPKKS